LVTESVGLHNLTYYVMMVES